MRGHDLNVLDAIVHEEDLPTAIQFPQHGVANQVAIETRDARFDVQAIFGGRLQVGDVAHADQAHVQRARDRRGGHREHVDGRAEGLQPLFDLHAESLLFVDDHQSQVVKPHVARREPMRADDDVDPSRRPARPGSPAPPGGNRSG